MYFIPYLRNFERMKQNVLFIFEWLLFDELHGKLNDSLQRQNTKLRDKAIKYSESISYHY